MNEDLNKPTLSKPVSPESKNLEKGFKPVMNQVNAMNQPVSQNLSEEELNEVDMLLNEREQSLKKKIFSLNKMEALVFSDPKLSAVYDEMSINGAEKFGYHYNETIMNMIFNDYVLNSAKYLQKYKMAIPKESKRRDKSGINQLKKAGQKKMDQTGTVIKQPDLEQPKEPVVDETTGAASSGAYSGPMGLQNKSIGISETTTAGSAGGAAGYVGYAGPAAWSKQGDLSGDFKKGANKAPIITKPIYKGGTIVTESDNYLIDPSGFEKMVNILNEQMDRNQENDTIINNTNSFNSDTIKNWNNTDTNLEMNTIRTGKMDSANLKTEGLNEMGNPSYGSIKTIEQIKALGRKLTREDIPMLGGDALYAVAMSRANKMLPMRWDDLADVNSMWDYIKPQGGMTTEQLTSAVKRAVNVRLKAEGYSLKDLGIMEEDVITERPKSEAQRIAAAIALHHPEKATGAAKEMISMGKDELEKFATKPKGEELPYHVEEASPGYIDLRYDDKLVNDRINQIRKPDKPSIDPKSLERLKSIRQNNTIKETTQSMIDTKEDSMSNKPTALGSQSQGMEIGMNSSMNEENINEFGLGMNEINQNTDDEAMIKIDNQPYYLKKAGDSTHFYMVNNPDALANAGGMGVSHIGQHSDEPYFPDVRNWLKGGPNPNGKSYGSNIYQDRMNESINILAEANNELKAFSIHQEKLKRMTEDKKPSSLVLKDRLGNDNQANFKKDLNHSGTKEIIDVEKELQWKDQQTEIGKDAQKLGADIEKEVLKKTKGEAFENVGDSTNEKGNEIPKRNMTGEEVKQVDMYRLGMSDLVYDNAPGKKFEDRMKAGMGDDIYKQREEKAKFRAEAPLYNKDTQPTEKGDKKEQYGKGLNETMVTGRYYDFNGKSHMVDFILGEAVLAEKKVDNWSAVSFDGLGNSYANKLNTTTHKLDINESVIGAITTNKFYIDENQVIHRVASSKTLNETVGEKPLQITNIDKMKHLSGYKPNTFTDNTNNKINRGF